jgi:hypothetical protein
LATSTRWFSTARLAIAFAENGCTVEAICRPGHPILKTTVPVRRYPYRDIQSLHSIERALTQSAPDLLVCCDEKALRLAHRVYRAALAAANQPLCRLLERSLGAPSHYDVALSRLRLMQAAAEDGVRVPCTLPVPTAAELPDIAARLGFPFVLKTDGSSGGTGVRIVFGPFEAVDDWLLLNGPASLPRTLYRIVANRELAPLYARLRRERHTVVAQQHIDGPEATLALACWRGEVLAAHTMTVVETWSRRGPSSVLRLVDSPEMLAAARALVRRLELSGLCGFDFILDRITNLPYLIEMNARPTQACHLALGPGRDLIAALTQVLRPNPGASPRPPVTDRDTIVLFPQELQRDPRSPWLQAGYHDLPVDQPRLTQAALAPNWLIRPNRSPQSRSDSSSEGD